MTKKDCFDLLEAFHARILTTLVPFAKDIEAMEAGGKWEGGYYSRIQLFKTFLETEVAAHTLDEEIAFYPILVRCWREAHSADAIHNPIGCMLREHMDVFAHTHTIGVLADILQAQPANTVALENLIGEAHAILTVLPLHIQKEEQFLFSRAREILPQCEIDAATELMCSLRGK